MGVNTGLIGVILMIICLVEATIVPEHTKRSEQIVGLENNAIALRRATPRRATWKRQVTGVEDLTVFNTAYLAAVNISGDVFDLIVDTGSADLWIAKKNFTCITSSGTLLPQNRCGFNHTYSGVLDPIPDVHFKISYGGGQWLLGDMSYQQVELGGVTIPKQQVGLVEKAYFPDNFSGILGLAYPLLTSAFEGSQQNSSHDSRAAEGGNQVPYESVALSMEHSTLNASMFSMSLSRNDDGSSGGYLSFGSMAPARTQGPTGSTNILKRNIFNAADGEILLRNFSYYTIQPEAISFAVAASNTTPPAINRTQLDQPMIVDSGTTLIYLPTDVALQILDQYRPKAFLDPEQGIYFAHCYGKPPALNITIGGVDFSIDAKDLLPQTPEFRSGDGQDCVTGIQPADRGPYALGSTFMNNVLSVFDISASEMRFVQRVPY